MDKVLLLLCVCAGMWQCQVNSLPTLPQISTGVLPCTEISTAGPGIQLECLVEKGQYLDYRSIRDLTNARPNETFNISIMCNGGSVYLPWPFRARHVVALKVQGCRVEGFLAEKLTEISIPDELEVIHFIDNVLEVTVRQLYDSLANLNNMTRDFECGQTNVRENVFRNIRYDFTMNHGDMQSLLLMEKLAGGDILKSIVRHSAKCVYPFLKYLEESGIDSLSSVHFKLAEESGYPELTTYSIRNNSLGRVPSELRILPVTYLPRLETLDLSFNKIGSLDFAFTGRNLGTVADPLDQRMIYIDMRYNNVRQLTKTFVDQLAGSNTAVIDLRNNPLTCSCPLYLYQTYLERLAQGDPRLNALGDIVCFMSTGLMEEQMLLDHKLGNDLCSGLW